MPALQGSMLAHPPELQRIEHSESAFDNIEPEEEEAQRVIPKLRLLTQDPPLPTALFDTPQAPHILPRGLVTLIGEDGAGKSHLAQHLTVSVATGQDLLGVGEPLTTGPVLYLSEKPWYDAQRFRSLLALADEPWPHPNISWTDGHREANQQEREAGVQADQRIDLCDKGDREVLAAQVAALAPMPLLVVDTLAAHAMTFSENDNVEAKLLVQGLSTLLEHVHTILLVHHPSKSEVSEQADILTGRGAGALRAACTQSQNLRQNKTTGTMVWYPWAKTNGPASKQQFHYQYTPETGLVAVDPDETETRGATRWAIMLAQVKQIPAHTTTANITKKDLLTHVTEDGQPISDATARSLINRLLKDRLLVETGKPRGGQKTYRRMNCETDITHRAILLNA